MVNYTESNSNIVFENLLHNKNRIIFDIIKQIDLYYNVEFTINVNIKMPPSITIRIEKNIFWLFWNRFRILKILEPVRPIGTKIILKN